MADEAQTPIGGEPAEAGGEAPPVVARPRQRWLRRVVIGCAGIMVLTVVLTLAIAFGLAYRFVSSPPPGHDPARPATPTHSEREAALTPAPPSARREPEQAAPARPLPLDRDMDRRARLSAKAKAAAKEWAKTHVNPSDPNQPGTDNSLPTPKTLLSLDPGDAADLGPFLAGLFNPPEAWAIPLEQPPRAVRAADFDGDGRADLMLLDWNGNRILLYGRGADGSYTLRGVEGIDRWAQRGTTVADFNGDGFTDILVPCGSVRSTLLWNRGGWNFEYQLLRIDWGALNMTTADLNRDGLLDVFFPNEKGVVMYGVSDQGLLDRGPRVLTKAAYSVTAADLNSDGVPDIVSLPPLEWRDPPDETTMTWRLLDSDGRTVGRSKSMTLPRPVWWLAPIRRTPQGPVDLVGLVARAYDMLLLKNSGDGDFVVERLGKSRHGGGVLVSDLNGDGWEDLIVGARVYLNQQGVLEARARFPGDLGPRYVAQPDVNGDGLLDLMLYDRNTHRILIYPRRADKPPTPPSEPSEE